MAPSATLDLWQAHVSYTRMLLSSLALEMVPENAARTLAQIEGIARQMQETLGILDPAGREVGGRGQRNQIRSSGNILFGDSGMQTSSVGFEDPGPPGGDLTARLIEEGMAMFQDAVGGQTANNLTRALLLARESGNPDIVAALEQKFSRLVGPLDAGAHATSPTEAAGTPVEIP